MSPAKNPSDRALVARIAANESWANTEDRSARTSGPRKAFQDRFDSLVDPAITDPAARTAAVENLRRAHYQRMALKSAQSRRAKAEAKARPRQSGGASPSAPPTIEMLLDLIQALERRVGELERTAEDARMSA